MAALRMLQMVVRVSQGTMSVLLGCHSAIHSTVVLVAWTRLYGRLPKVWQIVCIYLHDIGHWGKQYLDDYEAKKRHGELGAGVAKRLFGQRGYDLIAGHNPYNGTAKSMLYDPDKYSWVIAPTWWMWTNTIFEPKLIRKGSSRLQSVRMFKKAMTENQKSGFKELGHEIYLRQWGQSKGG